MDRVNRDRTIVRRVLVGALFAQAAVAVVLAGGVTFAAILILVGVKLRSDRDWLMVPIIVNGIAFSTVIAETLARQPGFGPPVLEPFLSQGSFLAIYAVGYRLLRPHRRTSGPPPRTKGLGWGFDKWSG